MDRNLDPATADTWGEQARQGSHNLFIWRHVPDIVEWKEIGKQGIRPFVSFPPGVKNPLFFRIFLMEPLDSLLDYLATIGVEEQGCEI